nr:molybdenum cofactor guanylyltransferase [uncultured Sphingomonas sp.]
MKILGAVLAGGRSSRFGSDKAAAMLGDITLLDRAIANLGLYCESSIIVGRSHPGLVSVDDWPQHDMGPLGGIAAALIHARDRHFDAALTLSVDGGMLTGPMVEALRPAPAHIASQPVIGLWTVSALAAVQAILSGDGKHSMMQFCEAIRSRPIDEFRPDNINTPADLEAATLKLKGANDRR